MAFFDPFLTSVMPSGVCNYLKMISNGLFSSAINLYYIYMEFEHFPVIIFVNIDDYVFLTGFIIIPPNLRSRPNPAEPGVSGKTNYIFSKSQINSRSFGEKSKPISCFLWIL